MDGGAWWAAVHGVSKNQSGLSDFTFTFTFMHWRRKWQPTPVFLPGESQGRGSLVGCRLWGCTESDTTEATQQQQHKENMDSNVVKISSIVLSYSKHSTYTVLMNIEQKIRSQGLTQEPYKFKSISLL